ncbi:transcription factor IIIB 90 kDa subunit [Schistocerca serialis cubense]|uniref:transcription factor IIIB 90 kDa subunit n=1 Tax=Schistocerca serialis cubense TaxID=2023355 RepID=UPI00214E1121|nr:transcription factor IIIB 90 kDa subunit [Schistocerca serialis cubense]
MSSNKCKNCGGTDIDVDPARGDAVCTSCGSVLEHSIIVSEIQFEDNAQGGRGTIGQFVSSDSKGGARNFGGAFHAGFGKESREITLRNAKRAVTNLAQQLRLNQHCIDTAYNFYKMALTRQLTKGRKNTHVVAACVYMTCRVEGTAHMLIDFSDVLQICVYELGRTYLRLSQALCINIPSMDPCLYILRFANRLEFGDKTHEVSMTALRLVQRMKRDSIHTGRRPSGLCGAALLIAARLHEFSRTVSDIIKIVKVHESTLKKRLIEFGETPSSALTLEEFMTIDLEEEQDPPSFKAARKKDKERLKMLEEEGVEKDFTELQREIEKLLDERNNKKRKRKVIIDAGPNSDNECEETENFIVESTLGTIEGCITDDVNCSSNSSNVVGLGPDIASMGLTGSVDDHTQKEAEEENAELDLDGIDDAEIDSYIMSEKETKYKDDLWMKINAAYLEKQKEKAEKLAKEKEEGKPEKKKRRCGNRKIRIPPSSSAGEAIEKMLQEKKISLKINYDVLKSLNAKDGGQPEKTSESTTAGSASSSQLIKSLPARELTSNKTLHTKVVEKTNELPVEVIEDKDDDVTPVPGSAEQSSTTLQTTDTVDVQDIEMDEAEDFEDEPEPEPENSEISLAQMLNHHRDDDEYYGADDYDEY